MTTGESRRDLDYWRERFWNEHAKIANKNIRIAELERKLEEKCGGCEIEEHVKEIRELNEALNDRDKALGLSNNLVIRLEDELAIKEAQIRELRTKLKQTPSPEAEQTFYGRPRDLETELKPELIGRVVGLTAVVKEHTERIEKLEAWVKSEEIRGEEQTP